MKDPTPPLRHVLLNKSCSIFITDLKYSFKSFRKFPIWVWQALKVVGVWVKVSKKSAKHLYHESNQLYRVCKFDALNHSSNLQFTTQSFSIENSFFK